MGKKKRYRETDPRKFSDKAERKNRNAQAVALKLAGFSDNEIANRLGFNSAESVRKALKSEINNLAPPKDREELRNIMFARYEHLLRSRYDQACNGDDDAYRLVLKTMQQAEGIMDLHETTTKIVGHDGGAVSLDIVVAAGELMDNLHIDDSQIEAATKKVEKARQRELTAASEVDEDILEAEVVSDDED